MIKIVVTVSDFGAAANVGGPVENVSAIIDVPTKNIPSILLEHLGRIAKHKENKNYNIYQTLSFSLLDES